MKVDLLLVCIIALVSFTGCIGSPPKQEPTTTTTNPFTTPAVPASAPSKSVFGTKTNETAGPQMFPASAQTGNTSTILNPAHGQPNHRCDIAVGAPLGSPAKQVQPMPAAQPTPTATLPATPPQPAKVAATTAGLNPAHGKPNHRCDIAVGAPLSSAPKQVQQPMPATQQMPAAQAVPAASSPSPNSGGSVKLNPAHGQPGHDCAVAVGQPLKS